jgi:transposase InsO family protein
MRPGVPSEAMSVAFVATSAGESAASRSEADGARSSRSVEQLRRALVEWVATYNERRLIARHGYRSPMDFRLSFPGA